MALFLGLERVRLKVKPAHYAFEIGIQLLKMYTNVRMKLYKILESIVSQEDVKNGVLYIKKYIEAPLNPYSYTDGVFKIRGVDGKTLAERLKSGDTQALAVIYNTPFIFENIRKAAVASVADLPHYEMYERNVAKNKIKSSALGKGIDFSKFTNPNIKPTCFDVINSKFMNILFTKYKSRLKKQLSLFTREYNFTSETSMSQLVQVVNDWKELKTGCIVYYKDSSTSDVEFCRLNTCSCDGPNSIQPSDGCSDKIKNVLEPSMLSSQCEHSGKYSGRYCYNCPNPNFGAPLKTAKDATESDYETHDVQSHFYIVCETPSFWDIVVEIGYKDYYIENIIATWDDSPNTIDATTCGPNPGSNTGGSNAGEIPGGSNTGETAGGSNTGETEGGTGETAGGSNTGEETTTGSWKIIAAVLIFGIAGILVYMMSNSGHNNSKSASSNKRQFDASQNKFVPM